MSIPQDGLLVYVAKILTRPPRDTLTTALTRPQIADPPQYQSPAANGVTGGTRDFIATNAKLGARSPLLLRNLTALCAALAPRKKWANDFCDSPIRLLAWR
jgi:hypothetical protein